LHYENGVIAVIEDFKGYKASNNAVYTVRSETHSWAQNSLRSSSHYYELCTKNTGFFTYFEILYESFDSLTGKIRSRRVSKSYTDNNGICKAVTLLTESFDSNNKYSQKITYEYLKDEDGVYILDRGINKSWDNVNSIYDISLAKYKNRNIFRHKNKSYKENKLVYESSSSILENDDGSYISLYDKVAHYLNHAIWYYEYTHKLNTEGIWYNDSYIFDDSTPEGVHILRDSCTYVIGGYQCERIDY